MRNSFFLDFLVWEGGIFFFVQFDSRSEMKNKNFDGEVRDE